MTLGFPWAGLGLLALLVLVPAASAKTIEVHLAETGQASAPYAFEPREVRVGVGDEVRWINDADVYHTVTHQTDPETRVASEDSEFNEVVSSKGDSAQYTFTEPGTYDYFCQPHSSFMFAKVIVEGATGSTGGVADSTQGTPGLEAPGALLVAALAAALVRRRV